MREEPWVMSIPPRCPVGPPRLLKGKGLNTESAEIRSPRIPAFQSEGQLIDLTLCMAEVIVHSGHQPNLEQSARTIQTTVEAARKSDAAMVLAMLIRSRRCFRSFGSF